MSGEQILFGLMIWCIASVPLALFMGNLMGVGAERLETHDVRSDRFRAHAHARRARDGQARALPF